LVSGVKHCRPMHLSGQPGALYCRKIHLSYQIVQLRFKGDIPIRQVPLAPTAITHASCNSTLKSARRVCSCVIKIALMPEVPKSMPMHSLPYLVCRPPKRRYFVTTAIRRW
jgi:hypothetical protein